ncbi:ABC transporter permease [Amycolatopsis mongoliensis]|uniref:Transport permease protein n=1 Tax=Amycolatopsis mongoliensis TaxID=715475 RepID=A0A9Y2NBE3_9PSEU|nr:ABC transporter permease [Amycolatopsis sp. 4-36]WIX98396.1 ABC transporter permease [Amycolatopsis sp. 4-36]
MSTLALTARDSATMLRRNLRHLRRYPGMMIMSLGMPVLLLLLFVGVFGGAMQAGVGSGQYIDYVVSGILLMTVGYGASMTALSVNRDMTEGIISRFRTMAIARVSVLTGHVLGAVLRTVVSAALVVLVALLFGFRPAAGAGGWFAAFGVVVLLALALTWLAVAVGLLAKNAEGANLFILVVQVLPFVSSAFVPPDSMSGAVRWFARHEPFTPVIDTLRGALLGTPVGDSGWIAVAWCAGFAVAGYVWARALFRRDPAA